LNIAVGLLLASEARIRQIFACRAAPDRHVHKIVTAVAESNVGFGDRLLEVCRESGCENRFPHLPASLPQICEVLCIQALKNLFDRPIQLRPPEKLSIGDGGNGKPFGT